jgi:hypothetical protein
MDSKIKHVFHLIGRAKQHKKDRRSGSRRAEWMRPKFNSDRCQSSMPCFNPWYLIIGNMIVATTEQCRGVCIHDVWSSGRWSSHTGDKNPCFSASNTEKCDQRQAEIALCSGAKFRFDIVISQPAASVFSVYSQCSHPPLNQLRLIKFCHSS